jgi:hypothetical protein
MAGMVDLADREQLLATVRRVVSALGVEPVLELVATVPGVAVVPGRPRGLLRGATPATVGYDDRVLVLEHHRPALHHVVGGIRLDSAPVADVAEPLAALIARTAGAVRDDVTARLTALRDAVDAAG